MFSLKGDYTILEINSVEEKIKNRLQGNVNLKIIKNEFYSKAKDYEDYKNYIIEKDVFIKSNPIVDVLKFMEGDYEFNSLVPSNEGNIGNRKINNPNNNAYIEIMGCYIVNKLTKKNYTNIFQNIMVHLMELLILMSMIFLRIIILLIMMIGLMKETVNILNLF